MKKKYSKLLTLIFFILLFTACSNEKEVFPQDNIFSSEIEIVSVTKNDDNSYTVQLKTILKTESETGYLIYGNPTCWNTLIVNGEGGIHDLPLGSFLISNDTPLIEEKNITISEVDFSTSQVYIKSEFFIEHKDGTKKHYTIESAIYNL